MRKKNKPYLNQINICKFWFQKRQTTIQELEKQDVQAASVQNFPFLRVNRFLAELAKKPLTEKQFRQWLTLANQLGSEAWLVQLKNSNQYSKLNWHQFKQCQYILTQSIIKQPNLQQTLLKNAIVPSEYLIWERILGAYYLTQIPFAMGVDNWRKQAKKAYTSKLNELTVKGDLITYHPKGNIQLSPAQITNIIMTSAKNPLRIPQPNNKNLSLLF